AKVETSPPSTSASSLGNGWFGSTSSADGPVSCVPGRSTRDSQPANATTHASGAAAIVATIVATTARMHRAYDSISARSLEDVRDGERSAGAARGEVPVVGELLHARGECGGAARHEIDRGDAAVRADVHVDLRVGGARLDELLVADLAHADGVA